MEILESRVTSKFQLTVPKLVREALGIEKGSEVVFLLEDKNVSLVPKPADPLEAMKALSSGKKFPRIRKEIRAARKEW